MRQLNRQAGEKSGSPKGKFGAIKLPTVKDIGAFLLETQELHDIVLKDYSLVHMNIDSC